MDANEGPVLQIARLFKQFGGIVAVVLFPAVALLIIGTIEQSSPLRWLAVPVAIAWAAFLSWRSVQAATGRLETARPGDLRPGPRR